MPTCELAFFGRPKRVHCTVPSQSELSTFPKFGWPQRRLALAEQGFLALLQPADTEYATLDELKLPSTEGFAIACFDIAEDRAGAQDCWFLPIIKSERVGLLLRKDVSDRKFRRLGLVVLVKEQVRLLYSYSSSYTPMHACMRIRVGSYAKRFRLSFSC